MRVFGQEVDITRCAALNFGPHPKGIYDGPCNNTPEYIFITRGITTLVCALCQEHTDKAWEATLRDSSRTSAVLIFTLEGAPDAPDPTEPG